MYEHGQTVHKLQILEREREINKFCVCKMSAAARGLQRYKVKGFGQTKFEPKTDRHIYRLPYRVGYRAAFCS